MRAACLLLCASLLACRTSDLGACAADTDCSANAICDGSRRVCVQTDAPQISNVSVTTAAGYTAPDGKLFFDTAGSPLSVSATIASRAGAGVDPASACLRLTGETGACAHPGTATVNDTFTFALPRPAGPADGTPLGFSISAASASGHSSTSATQQIYFDDQPPSVSVAPDSTPYARALPDGGAVPAIVISATVTDAVGVAAPELLSGATAIPPSSANGNVYVFQLDPRDAPAGLEAPYQFHIRAVDRLGHDGGVDAVRVVDDVPPDASVKVFAGSVEPGSPGVTYPALTANTGWTGNSFIYSDVVHVKGTITDLSGIGSATLHIDGIELDGGVSAGTARSLGCTAGTTCTFDVQIALNDAQNGAFHTGTGVAVLPGGTASIPSGLLHVVIDATDNAVVYGGAPAGRTTHSDSPARATRFLWSTALVQNSGATQWAVTGLAVHPNDGVVATTDGGTSTVFELSRADGTIMWSADAGTVLGPPAVGAGGAADAPIYTANLGGFITAFAPGNGAPLWTATGKNFSVGPAVARATVGGATVDQVLVADNINTALTLWSVTASANVPTTTQSATSARDRHASPMIFDGGVWFGTGNGVEWHPLPGDGTVGNRVVVSSTAGAYDGTITDGTRVFAATHFTTTPAELHAITPLLADAWTHTYVGGVSAAAEPTIAPGGVLYVPDTDGGVTQYVAANGGNTGAFLGVTGPAHVPLQGSDGGLYLPRGAGGTVTDGLIAIQGGATSWIFDPPGTMLRAAAIDCEGRLFAGTGGVASAPAVVWAFVTGDQGLADTPWPSWRRDARNTGNADNPIRYGIRTAPGPAGCTQ